MNDELKQKIIEAFEASQVFITPVERIRNWNEYKEDAAIRIREMLALLRSGEPQ